MGRCTWMAMCLVVAWSMPGWGGPAERFVAWVAAEGGATAELATALGETGDARAVRVLDAWLAEAERGVAGGRGWGMRNAARLARARLRDPARLPVAEVVRLEAGAERRALVQGALERGLFGVVDRRQLRAWSGLTDDERFALALADFRETGGVEDADWLATRLATEDAASSAVLLHEGGDGRGTAWLTERLAVREVSGEGLRELAGLLRWMVRIDARRSAGLALVYGRDAGGGAERWGLSADAIGFAMRAGLGGAERAWLDRFSGAEREVDRLVLAGSVLMNAAGVLPGSVLAALEASETPAIRSQGAWLRLLQAEPVAAADDWSAWFGEASDGVVEATLVWLGSDRPFRAVGDRYAWAVFEGLVAESVSSEERRDWGSAALVGWLEAWPDGGERDAALASWVLAFDGTLPVGFWRAVSGLPAEVGGRTKDALLRRADRVETGPELSVYGALVSAERRRGAIDAATVATLRDWLAAEASEESSGGTLRGRAAWWWAVAGLAE